MKQAQTLAVICILLTCVGCSQNPAVRDGLGTSHKEGELSGENPINRVQTATSVHVADTPHPAWRPPASLRTEREGSEALLMLPGDIRAALTAWYRSYGSLPPNLESLQKAHLLPFAPLTLDGKVIERIEGSLDQPGQDRVVFEFQPTAVRFRLLMAQHATAVTEISLEAVKEEATRLGTVFQTTDASVTPSTGQLLIGAKDRDAAILYAWLSRWRIRVYRFVQLEGRLPASLSELTSRLGEVATGPESDCPASLELGARGDQGMLSIRLAQKDGFVEHCFGLPGRRSVGWRDWYEWSVASDSLVEKGSIQTEADLLPSEMCELTWVVPVMRADLPENATAGNAALSP